MNQQINLYHPIFRRQEKKFSARAMLQASALLLAGTVIMYAFAWWQVGALRSQITQAERAQQAAVKQLEDISHTLGVKATDPRLEQDVRELEARVNASQQIEAVLQQDAFARSVGYSNYFAAFARQIVPGLWLTGVTITGAGEQLLLRGRSSTPELVPRYLQKLSAEKILSGARFQVFQITRPEKLSSTSAPTARDGGSAENAGAAFLPYVEFVVKTGGAGEMDAGDTQEASQ